MIFHVGHRKHDLQDFNAFEVLHCIGLLFTFFVHHASNLLYLEIYVVSFLPLTGISKCTFGTSSFRRTLLEQVREEFSNARIPVTIKLGGETSFDIFPNGWDKTYAMNHFEGYEIYFLGDRCGDNGNDKEIFDALQPECSFWVEGTQHTKEILQEILIPKLRK